MRGLLIFLWSLALIFGLCINDFEPWDEVILAQEKKQYPCIANDQSRCPPGICTKIIPIKSSIKFRTRRTHE